ncbi:MAG: C10 family peptidase [Bacteroidales bacterium]|nr:C10 family peptidase [Bacteroidales bacterium]
MKTSIAISFIALFSMLILNSFASNVDLESASKVASHKIQTLHCEKEFQVKTVEIYRDEDGKDLFYAFQLVPVGYIMVAADIKLPPVIAYSFTNDFRTSDQNNILIEFIKADIINRLDYAELISPEIRKKGAEEWKKILESDLDSDARLFEQWPPEGTTVTGGWLETNWTQNAPYNNFCPMDPVTNQRSIAGCPAVAMAQIINYYKTINETEFSDADDYYHSYSGRNYWIDDDFEAIDFPSFPELNVYMDTLAECYANQVPLKTNEKAALNFACGVAAKQVYTSSISGTYGVNQAYNAFLRFGFSEAVLMDDTDTTLYTVLAHHMMEARPVHLAVVDPAWSMGHNLVIDGYNTDEYFHLNFGWGGAYNGWYLLPEEIPYGLTVVEGVIVDIAYPPVYTGAKPTEFNHQSPIRISPNPASSFVNIDLDLIEIHPLLLNIFDSKGKLILSRNLNNLHKEVSEIRLDLTSSNVSIWSPGLYFCEVIAGDHRFSAKFIVQ